MSRRNFRLSFACLGYFSGGLMAVALLVLPGSTLAQAPDAEIQLNVFTTGGQFPEEIKALDDGRFLVVWTSPQNDFGAEVPVGRFLDADGAPIGSEIELENNIMFEAFNLQVVAQSAGEFVLTYRENLIAGLRGQRYSSTGTKLGLPIIIQNDVDASAASAQAEGRDNGDFVVVWWSDPLGGERELRMRRFASDGAPFADSVRVSDEASFGLDVHADGQFVIARCIPDSYSDVLVQRYDSTGTALGAEVVAGDRCTRMGDVAYADDGSFLVTWDAFNPVTNQDIEGRIFDSSGSPTGTSFLVSSTIPNDSQQRPQATKTAGGFAVVWESTASEIDFTPPGVQMQHLGPDGSFVDGLIQVNTYTESNQSTPKITDGPHGPIVTWTSIGSFGDDSSSGSVQLRSRFDSIFVDGFESGDTTRWRVTVP